ncbi:putative inorganic phosphate cotransporter [Euwallacea similis]|uniref:putative inorganic phosphate cotransporter n=1 Tax=Euwallacea similis TaxID=1736056 RepID=UPI003450E819
MSVAIVAMTDPNASSNPSVPTYSNWTQKGTILSSFFWGYIWPQPIAGIVATRFGAKWFLVVTMGIQCLISVGTPLIAAHLGQFGTMGGRAIQGFCQGFLIPSIACLLGRWVPREERSRMGGIVYGAIPLGTVVSLLGTGVISASWYGWPMVFYVYGLAGLLFCLMLAFMGYNSPADHPNIGREEKFYIEKSLGYTDKKSSRKIPWTSILTSKPLWALVATQCGFVFGFWVLLSQIPTYMKFVLNFDIKKNSLLSSLPYLVYFFMAIILSFISDLFINRGYLSQSVSRKLFNSIGMILSAFALILMGYVKPDEPSKSIWLLIITIGLMGGVNCGLKLNHMDLSPNHSGTLMGLCNGFSNILGIVAPLAVQYIVKDETDPVQWRSVFFLAAAIQIITGLIFVFFGSGDVQSWNITKDDGTKNKT